MTEYLWPILTLLAWCFGYCAGVAWSAHYRPTIINVRTVIQEEGA